MVDYFPGVVKAPRPEISIYKVPAIEGLGQFDWVLASAIIEHIPSAKTVLHDLLSSLAPGGLFYARTPWAEPFVRLLGRLGVKFDFTYPAHLYDMGADFWDSLQEHPEFSGFELCYAGPSIVEVTLREHFVRSVVSRLIKLPYHLFGRNWKFPGGWEVIIRRSDADKTGRR